MAPAVPDNDYASNRDYQDGKRYYLPKDTIEQDRLDAQSNAILALMKNKPFHADVKNPKKILDVGCGTGSMTSLLARTFPSAQVIGIDLAPVPPSRHTRLPNVEYIQGDIQDLMKSNHELLQPGTFDYIFSRLLLFGLTDWPGYISSATSLLAPGGWLECHDVDMHILSPAPRDEDIGATMPWLQKFESDSKAVGLDIYIGSKLRGYFQRPSPTAPKGLENIRQEVYPFNLVHQPGLEDSGYLVTQVPRIFTVVATKVASGRRSEEELKQIVEEINETWARGFESGSRYRCFAVAGQKPATTE